MKKFILAFIGIFILMFILSSFNSIDENIGIVIPVYEEMELLVVEER